MLVYREWRGSIVLKIDIIEFQNKFGQPKVINSLRKKEAKKLTMIKQRKQFDKQINKFITEESGKK